MAFVAGLILFYVPEEPAFQLFGRLLSSSGPNLRRFYLPGLAGLKAELVRFDRLMQRHMPALRKHLEVRLALWVWQRHVWCVWGGKGRAAWAHTLSSGQRHDSSAVLAGAAGRRCDLPAPSPPPPPPSTLPSRTA